MQKTHDKDGKTLFTLTAALPAGTHHIRFLVDGEMIVSEQYQQTVDFTNSLVNYIEIAATTPPAQDMQQPAPAEPVPIPGAEVPPTEDGATQPVDIPRDQAPETQDTQSSTLQETIAPVPGSHDNQSKPIPIRAHDPRQEHHPSQDSQTDNSTVIGGIVLTGSSSVANGTSQSTISSDDMSIVLLAACRCRSQWRPLSLFSSLPLGMNW